MSQLKIKNRLNLKKRKIVLTQKSEMNFQLTFKNTGKKTQPFKNTGMCLLCVYFFTVKH